MFHVVISVMLHSCLWRVERALPAANKIAVVVPDARVEVDGRKIGAAGGREAVGLKRRVNE